MKKLQLKALELGAKEVLSRVQLKNVLGGSGSGSGSGTFSCYGGPCTLTIQGDNGTFITRTGNCVDASTLLAVVCYCDTGLGNVPVTSNGHVSKCTK